MSKSGKGSERGDWLVHLDRADYVSVTVRDSRMWRDKRGGYVFVGLDGMPTDFPPGAVLYVESARHKVAVRADTP